MVDKKEENDKLEEIEHNICAEREVFISKYQQVDMAMDGGNKASVRICITKGDTAPPPLMLEKLPMMSQL